MSEKPAPNFFPMSDGGYCHVLPDRIVVVSNQSIKKVPEPKDGPSYSTIVLLLLGGIVAMFFCVNFVLTQYYPLAFCMLVVATAIVFALRTQMSYSATDCILRSSIIKVVFRKKAMGFDAFIIQYRGANGKIYFRRIGIYDSPLVNQQAQELFYNEELL